MELSSIAIMMNTSRILSKLTILSRGRATATNKDNRRDHPTEKGKRGGNELLYKVKDEEAWNATNTNRYQCTDGGDRPRPSLR